MAPPSLLSASTRVCVCTFMPRARKAPIRSADTLASAAGIRLGPASNKATLMPKSSKMDAI